MNKFPFDFFSKDEEVSPEKGSYGQMLNFDSIDVHSSKRKPHHNFETFSKYSYYSLFSKNAPVDRSKAIASQNGNFQAKH